MPIRNIFGRKRSTLAPTPLPPPAPITLARAPAYQPLPSNAADPLDAAVVALWLAYQSQAHPPTWSGFIASLVATNTELANRIRAAQTELADATSRELFRP